MGTPPSCLPDVTHGTNTHLELLNQAEVKEYLTMCDPNLFTPPLWSMIHCADQLHLTTRPNLRIRLLLGCQGLESDVCRFSSQSNGQARGDPSCKLCGAQLEDAPHFISTCLSLETKHRELLRHAPPQLQDQELELPDPARDPDLFAHVMLRIDWV